MEKTLINNAQELRAWIDENVGTHITLNGENIDTYNCDQIITNISFPCMLVSRFESGYWGSDIHGVTVSREDIG